MNLFPIKNWLLLLVIPLVFSQSVVTPIAAQEPWLRAPALKPGDTIAFVAPAGPVEIEPVNQYMKQLEAAGFRVLVPQNIERNWEYLAGTDEQRADELNSAIRNPEVDAIFAIRGGFGLTRILDRIDYDALRKSPKVVVGYSDLTALHLAIARKIQLISFHGPMPMSNLWQGDAPKYKYANDTLHRTIFAEKYAVDLVGFAIPLPANKNMRALFAGKATGRLIGGNLSLICATLGTPYAITPKGAILFLEDVNEAPYRVDRMLSQLRLAGVLEEVSGVAIGDFSTRDTEDRLATDRVLVEYFGRLHVPVVMNFPVGHIPDNATIPHGALAEIDSDNLSLRLLENPVEWK
ncbi:MAG: LD-carboxypeptidase [Pirellula sp.]|jgi:muramoyltetrapeptide carboxypeptidase|nr:LD-carboxypeptidase [Pirellula sp.]